MADARVQWIRSNPEKAHSLVFKAVVGGYDIDGADLWVIRTIIGGELLPAKFNQKKREAFVAVDSGEKRVNVFEVCCVEPRSLVRWVECSHGRVPDNAVVGGETSSGETLYIGRARQGSSLCPGMVHPSDGVLYLSYAFKTHKHKRYEVLCLGSTSNSDSD